MWYLNIKALVKDILYLTAHIFYNKNLKNPLIHKVEYWSQELWLYTVIWDREISECYFTQGKCHALNPWILLKATKNNKKRQWKQYWVGKIAKEKPYHIKVIVKLQNYQKYPEEYRCGRA